MNKIITTFLFSSLSIGAFGCKTLSEDKFIALGKESSNVFMANITLESEDIIKAKVYEVLYGNVKLGDSLKINSKDYKFKNAGYYVILADSDGDKIHCKSAIEGESEFGTDTLPVIELVNYFQGKS